MKLRLSDKVITPEGKVGIIVSTKEETNQYGVAYGEFLIGLDWFNEDDLKLSGVPI